MLATTRIVRLVPLTVAFIRHLGPYEGVSPDSFARLTAWALRRGGGTPLLLGIARDAPGITPAAKIRFDCCVQVPAAFDTDGDIGCQRTPGGDHAITEYVGSWDTGGRPRRPGPRGDRDSRRHTRTTLSNKASCATIKPDEERDDRPRGSWRCADRRSARHRHRLLGVRRKLRHRHIDSAGHRPCVRRRGGASQFPLRPRRHRRRRDVRGTTPLGTRTRPGGVLGRLLQRRQVRESVGRASAARTAGQRSDQDLRDRRS